MLFELVSSSQFSVLFPPAVRLMIYENVQILAFSHVSKYSVRYGH